MNKVVSSRRIRRSLSSRIIDGMMKKELMRRAKKHNERRSTPIAVFANDWIGININLNGLYEGEAINDLIQLLRALKVDVEQSCAVDIGANVGNHSIEFSKHFSRVVCFEPNPRTFDLLSANTKRLSNVSIHNFGCASSVGKIKFFEDFCNIGGSSSVLEIPANNEIEIVVKPLDDLFDDLSKVELIKIDVEGMEYSALRGAERVISKFHPTICLEQHEGEFKSGYTETKSIDWLRSMGYRMFALKNEKRKCLIFRRLDSIKRLVLGLDEKREIIEYVKLPKSTYTMVYAVHQSKCL